VKTLKRIRKDGRLESRRKGIKEKRKWRLRRR
jgi:hypothetical protein